ncbi:sortase-like acyltransferase [Burkholderia sp. Ch1-1]|uniref:GNAT family N-acetyltransferase n=1 Tax=Paraburkholderia sp. USG1 TaxID=2952268 RepID=UPI0001D22B43|nr:GNAT family N-acetyltransferase [Paraburkholderia sp. USG1]EIF34659.1 sortase-like acyltransferase [Burkholderia sp. Ch1-1]MDR8395536.1 GNAT family N-acetyltransferase [Paraburkholderia sp. USG1]
MYNNAVLIRQLGPDDRDDYFQLRLRGLRAHPDSFGQSYEEALAKGASQHDAMLEGSRAAEGDFLLGAYASAATALIGVVGLLRIPSDKQRHKAAVVGMYVAPEAAGCGVGRALLNELLARASHINGLRQIQPLVGSRNEAARKLYESLGFRKYGCEVGALNVDGVFHDADLMALFIQ